MSDQQLRQSFSVLRSILGSRTAEAPSEFEVLAVGGLERPPQRGDFLVVAAV